jgi:hypothetical protein
MSCPVSTIFCSTVALITINGPHILPSIACYITLFKEFRCFQKLKVNYKQKQSYITLLFRTEILILPQL